MNDYQTLYKALSLRCSQVAEKLRLLSRDAAQMATTFVLKPEQIIGEKNLTNAPGKILHVDNTVEPEIVSWLNGLANTLDTPMSVQESAELLHLDRSEAK